MTATAVAFALEVILCLLLIFLNCLLPFVPALPVPVADQALPAMRPTRNSHQCNRSGGINRVFMSLRGLSKAVAISNVQKSRLLRRFAPRNDQKQPQIPYIIP